MRLESNPAVTCQEFIRLADLASYNIRKIALVACNAGTDISDQGIVHGLCVGLQPELTPMIAAWRGFVTVGYEGFDARFNKKVPDTPTRTDPPTKWNGQKVGKPPGQSPMIVIRNGGDAYRQTRSYANG